MFGIVVLLRIACADGSLDIDRPGTDQIALCQQGRKIGIRNTVLFGKQIFDLSERDVAPRIIAAGTVNQNISLFIENQDHKLLRISSQKVQGFGTHTPVIIDIAVEIKRAAGAEVADHEGTDGIGGLHDGRALCADGIICDHAADQ